MSVIAGLSGVRFSTAGPDPSLGSRHTTMRRPRVTLTFSSVASTPESNGRLLLTMVPSEKCVPSSVHTWVELKPGPMSRTSRRGGRVGLACASAMAALFLAFRRGLSISGDPECNCTLGYFCRFVKFRIMR